MAKRSKHWRRLLEVSIALELAKSQRDYVDAQNRFLEIQLAAAVARAERAEKRLHEATRMVAEFGRDSLRIRNTASTAEVWVEGRSILRLQNPRLPPDSTKVASS